MQRLNAASCLLAALFTGTALCHPAERMKVQVVQTHAGVKLGATGVQPVSDSDLAWSRCNGISGIYSREFGFHCGESSLAQPAQPLARGDYAFFYDVRVIMPDAARLVFHCSTILNRHCQGFPEYPENTRVECGDFVFGGRAYKDCTATAGAAESIGVYEAALHGNRMTIFGSHWRRSYLQYGTWEINAISAQDSKPAPPQETKPVTAQDPRPEPAQETKPASPPDAQSAPAQPATADSKPADTPPATPGPSAPADQVVDPRVIEEAKAGDAIAQYKLGYHYFLGRGVPVDYVQAAIWWKKSAEQGYPQAQNNLGVLYNSGKGVPQSYAEAYFWQNLAASRASGDLQTQFAKNRDESGSKLWLLSRLKIQQRAAKWATEHPVPARTHEPPPEEKRSEYP